MTTENGRLPLKPLLSGAAGLGALAGLNRFLASNVGPLTPQLPARPLEYDWRYGRVTYYEDGPRDAPLLLLLHSHNAAGSAREMVEPFVRLREEYRVIAPDLLGYGLSARPPIYYTAATYIELLRDFLREVVRQPAPVLALSVSAAHAIQVAADDPEWITQLALVVPTGLKRQLGQPSPGRALTALFRLPVLGEALFNGLASHYYLRKFLTEQTYYDPEKVTDQLVELNYRTTHQPGARFAPASFVGGALGHDVHDAWPRVGQPTLLIWGAQAAITPQSDAAAFLALNPGAELETIDSAGLVPQDEQPEEFARILRDWLVRTRPE